jgi:hypothetical protein
MELVGKSSKEIKEHIKTLEKELRLLYKALEERNALDAHDKATARIEKFERIRTPEAIADAICRMVNAGEHFSDWMWRVVFKYGYADSSEEFKSVVEEEISLYVEGNNPINHSYYYHYHNDCCYYDKTYCRDLCIVHDPRVKHSKLYKEMYEE